MALLVPLFVLVGCAAGTDPGVATAADPAAPAEPVAGGSGPATAEDPQERGRQFAQCMRDHGVDMPDPDDSGRVTIQRGAGGDQEDVEAAMQACEQYAPFGGERPELDPAQLEELRAHSRCIRDNGVPSFPDPGSDGGIAIRAGEGSDIDPEALERAKEACRDQLPDIRGTS